MELGANWRWNHHHFSQTRVDAGVYWPRRLPAPLRRQRKTVRNPLRSSNCGIHQKNAGAFSDSRLSNVAVTEGFVYPGTATRL